MTFLDTHVDFKTFDPAAFLTDVRPVIMRDEDQAAELIRKKAEALRAAAHAEIERAQSVLQKTTQNNAGGDETNSGENSNTANTGENQRELSERDRRRIENFRTTAKQLTEWADEVEKLGTEQIQMAAQPVGRKSEPTSSGGDMRLFSERGSATNKRETSRAGLSGKAPFMSMFPRQARSQFKNSHEFFAALNSGRFDPRLQRPQSFGSESVGQAGGFLVPPEIVADIFDQALSMEIVRPLAKVHPMMSSDLQLVSPDSRDRTNGRVGGFLGQWLGEGAEANIDTPSFNKHTLSAHKLAIFTQASIEVQADAPAFVETVTAAIAESLAFTMDGAFIDGNGVGKPLGFLNADSLIVQDTIAGQAPNTVTYRNLADMIARLSPGSWKTATWVCSQTVLSHLMRLSFTAVPDDGSTSTEVVSAPIFSTNAAGEFLLMGRPLLVSEHMPPLGNQGDITLCDFTQYVVGLRADATLETSNAPGWTRSLIDYRMIARVDGGPRGATPATPRKGLQVSPFVTLAARSSS